MNIQWISWIRWDKITVNKQRTHSILFFLIHINILLLNLIIHLNPYKRTPLLSEHKPLVPMFIKHYYNYRNF